MQRTPLYFLTGIATFLLLCFAMQEWVYRGSTKAHLELDRLRLQRHLPYFLNTLQQYDVFPQGPSRQNNAVHYLDARVRWSFPSIGEIRPLKSGASVFETPSPPLASPFNWRQTPPSVDFSWLKEISKYDHWDLTQSPPVQQANVQLRDGEIGIDEFFDKLPTPMFSDLAQIAIARLMKSMKDGSLLQALREVRHLAYLCYTTETIDGLRSANFILVAEAEAYEHGVSKNLIRKQDWIPVQNPDALRKMPQYSGRYYSFHANAKTIEDAFGTRASAPARCAIMQEGLKEITTDMRYFDSSFPFQRDWSDIISALKRVGEDPAKQCRFGILRDYWKDPSLYWSAARAPAWIAVAGVFPYLRSVGGLYRLSSDLNSPSL